MRSTTSSGRSRDDDPPVSHTDALDRIAQQALLSYDLPAGAVAELVNLSENATFAVRLPDGEPMSALRVHRLDYHPDGAIASELCWIDALRADGVVATPAIVQARYGEGHVLLFANNPMWRGETIGSWPFVMNAVANSDRLDATAPEPAKKN